jgi:FixJ family two-component response regulator
MEDFFDEEVAPKIPLIYIEDDPVCVEIATHMLSTQYRITPFRTLTEAKINLCDYEARVILLDFALPDGTALDFLDFILEEKIDLPVIIVTKFSDHQNMVQCWQKGAFDFIEKPFSKKKLIDSLDLAMNHRPPFIKNEFFEKHLAIKEILFTFDYEKLREILDENNQAITTVISSAITELNSNLASLIEIFSRIDYSSENMTPHYFLHKIEGLCKSIYAGHSSIIAESLLTAISRGENLLISDIHQLQDSIERLVARLNQTLCSLNQNAEQSKLN